MSGTCSLSNDLILTTDVVVAVVSMQGSVTLYDSQQDQKVVLQQNDLSSLLLVCLEGRFMVIFILLT